MVKEGLTWRLSCWRDEVQKMQVQEANVAIDCRNARCKSYSDSRQCWRNTSVHGHVACLVGRARDPLDDVAPVQHVCVWVSCVYDFARFVYLPHCSELYSAALSLCMRFGAPRRLNLTAEIALASPHPPRCYAPRSYMHTGASGHAKQPGRCLHTLGGAGRGYRRRGTRRKGERFESARVSE
jgi:hypothetical protein